MTLKVRHEGVRYVNFLRLQFVEGALEVRYMYFIRNVLEVYWRALKVRQMYFQMRLKVSIKMHFALLWSISEQ